MNQAMEGLVLICKCIHFVYVLLQTYIWQKKFLIDLLKVKKNILHYCVHREENGRQIKRVWNSAMVRVILNNFNLFQIATQKNVHIVYIPSHERPFDVSCGNLDMAMAPYRYTLKRIAKRWRSKNIITSMG